MRFFSDYFKLDIKIPETDYIDIYKVNSAKEIFDFMIMGDGEEGFVDILNLLISEQFH